MSLYHPNSTAIAAAVAFKEYLLLRDVESRRAILAACIEDCSRNENKEEMKDVKVWFQMLTAVNDIPDSDQRKQSIRADAYWTDLFTVHAKDWTMVALMRTYVK